MRRDHDPALLARAGIAPADWQRISSSWSQRMAHDRTGALTARYSSAYTRGFTNARG